MTKIRLRAARVDDCPALARIIIEATRDAFRGRVPDECFSWLSLEQSEVNWRRNFQPGEVLERGTRLVVAEVGDGDVVGLALAGATTSEQTHDPAVAEEFPIDLHSLQVAPEWQRQGVGRKLVAEVARLFSGDGVSGLMVRVLVDNPNVGFYERLGARRIGVQPYDWEGYATEEIVFGWGGLAGFFERSGDVG